MTLRLFNALIKPILLYSSDYWGCLKMPNNNPIENVHMRFCKDILGVQKQTTNVGVLLELGEIPISIFAKKQCIKNFHRIHFIKNANSIVLSSLSNPLNKETWLNPIKTCLDKIGIGLSNPYLIYERSFERMRDIFYQESFFNIKKENNKLRTFAKVKIKIGLETYLKKCNKINNRIAISKFRLSNHGLMIEKGRHLQIDKSLRFCPFCPTLVESEEHFLLECRIFTSQRMVMLDKIKDFDGKFKDMQQHDKFIYLLTEENAIHHVGTFLHDAFTLRKLLLMDIII